MAHSSPPLTMKDFLTTAFVDWQHQMRQRKTLREFADYLEVSRDLLNSWMIGRRNPGEDYVLTLAQKLGNGIFRIEGYQHLHPEVQAIARAWASLTLEQQAHLLEMFDAFRNENARQGPR